MEKLKKILSKIKYYRVICISLVLVLALISLVLKIILGIQTARYTDQTMASRWDSNNKYSHISLFIKDSANVDGNSISELEYNINKQLEINNVDNENENGRKFIDSYMAKNQMNLESDRKSVNVKCMAVGGDFFDFHPVKLLSGQYFSGNDLMHDGVILDEETAWELFGSSDVADQQIYWEGKLLYVRGVYERGGDHITEYARGDEPEIFVPYELLCSEDYSPSIVCIEICMPNPVENFASKIVTDVFKVDTNSFEMVENSTRFTVEKLWKINKEKKYRSMQNRDIIFPYWEKIARYQEERLAPVAVWMMICIIAAGTIFVCFALYEISIHTRLKPTRDDV